MSVVHLRLAGKHIGFSMVGSNDKIPAIKDLVCIVCFRQRIGADPNLLAPEMFVSTHAQQVQFFSGHLYRITQSASEMLADNIEIKVISLCMPRY